MRAKLVVFPIRGRSWCFSRTIDPSTPGGQSPNTPSTFRELYSVLFSSNPSSVNGCQSSEASSKVELVVDFLANKMNVAWINLEKAPQGTIKNKIHGFGLKLLSRVKPSEIFFKSIPKEIDSVEITYPSSLNPRLVRRRLRHIAFSGHVRRFGKKGKLSPRFIGPFEILDRVGSLAYRVALPPRLLGVHNVFHVSMLRKYMANPSHVLNFEPLQLSPDLSYEERPTQILGRQEKKLRNKVIKMVKVKWLNHSDEEATWETEADMRLRHPELFGNENETDEGTGGDDN